MDERLTVKVGDNVRTYDGYRGIVTDITYNGLRVVVRTRPDGEHAIGTYHPTKVWPE